MTVFSNVFSNTFSNVFSNVFGVGGNPLLTNLVAYWKLDEASGTREDIVGSFDLTDNNTVGQSGGVINNAADFTSSNNEYLESAATNVFDVDLAKGFTFAAWIKVNDTGTSIIASHKDGPSVEGWIIFSSGGQAIFRDETNGNLTSSTSIQTGKWHLVVCWIESNTKKIEVDNNGTVDTQSIANFPTAGSHRFLLGAQETASGSINMSQLMDGAIDEVGVWNRALTAEERSTLYNSGYGRTYPFDGSWDVIFFETNNGNILESNDGNDLVIYTK